MSLLVAIIALAGHGVGYAQGSDLCKEAKIVNSQWASPPLHPPGRKSQALLACSQDFVRGVQFCIYSDDKKANCTVLVDQPSSPKWEAVAVSCETGMPLEESKL